jgi:hypothetical protein
MADLNWTTTSEGYKRTTFTSGGTSYIQEVRYDSNNIPTTWIYESAANGEGLLARVRNDGTPQLTLLGGSYGNTFVNVTVKEAVQNTKSLDTNTEPPPKDGETDGPNSNPTQDGVQAIGPLDPKAFQSGDVGSFSYPSTITNRQDRVVISQYQYKRSQAIQTETQFQQNLKKVLGTVVLPMPNDLSEANSVGWGEDSLSNVAALMMPGLTGMAVATAGADLGQFKNSTIDIMNSLKNRGLDTRVQQVLQVNAAAALLKKVNINVNPEAYISRVTSAAINPNLELLFNGPKLRQFSLAYKMVARSPGEAKQIRGILRFFKKGMAPQRSNQQEFSFFLGSPNVFRVSFESSNGPLKSIGQFKTCALVAFSANYTPDGFYAAYEDSDAGGSQPIAVTMQMGFTELTPVFNDEYDDGKMDDVGPNKFDTDYNVLNLTGSTDGEGNNSAPGNEQRGVSGPPTPGTQTAGR